MNYQNVIDYKLKILIDLLLTDGVGPSDLAENIFSEDYISISFSKKGGYIIGKLNFYEKEEMLQNVQMFYTYTSEKRLIRIEEEVNGSKRLLWDRKCREEELIEELLYFMSNCYNHQQIEDFVMSLPESLREKFVRYIKLLSA